MSDPCPSATCAPGLPLSPAYRRVLWVALLVNLAMFAIEIVAGWSAASAALLADAVDFLGDAANYAFSLFVLSMGLAARARAALIKGLAMGAYGLYVLGQATWNGAHGLIPEPLTMGAVGLLALVANVGVAALLYAYRNGDANMRSVWLCSRNDAIANIAIVVAAAGVVGTNTAWPDLAVAAIMGVLGLSAAREVVRQARRELAEAAAGGRHAHA
jgi:Co/Zn/Cd efflux system component